MTWISLVCLLALSSAAFGQSSYGVFSGSSLFKPKPVVPAPLPLPTPVADIPLRPAPVFSNNYGSYDKFESRKLSFDLPKPATLPLSEADILCQGKPEGHIIVLLSGEKFVICTTDSKGDEFFCPKGLLYNDETKRCERKFNPNKNPCGSQPCLNGGRCIPTQYTYQCECSQGFSGRTCELDASVCQQQQPCGQSFDSFCQSFHVGAALKHVCILQEGRSYGLTGQQTFSNPCLTSEGIHPLAFGNKGFIMCDGDSMFVESCPGGTIWDSLTKVCVWPEMEGTISIKTITNDVPSYSEPLPLPRPVEPLPLPRPAEPLPTHYGSMTMGRKFDFPAPIPPRSGY